MSKNVYRASWVALLLLVVAGSYSLPTIQISSPQKAVQAQATYSPSCALFIGGSCFSKAEKDRFESNTVTTGGGVILISGISTSGRGSSFRNGTGTAFQVGTGLTLRCRAIRGAVAGSAGLASYQAFLGRSTAEVTYDTASPGTSPLYYGGASVSPFVGTDKNFEASMNWILEPGMFPFFAASGGPASAQVWCFID